MPTDPVTGERLPYAGEPGAPAGAPPMPPGGAGAPPMPQGGEMPQGDAGMEALEQDAQSRMQAIAEQAPAPEGKGFSVKVVQSVTDELNAFADEAMGEGVVPPVEFEAEGSTWSEPLPPNVFVPMVAIDELAGEMGGEKYQYEPMNITNDGALRKAAANIKRMRNDSDFMEAITAVPGEAEAAEEAPPPEMGEMNEEDEELMAAM